MKNLLTQWEYWGEKPKDPWNVIGEKPPNLQVGYFLGGTQKRIEQERGLGLLCSFGGGAGGPNKLTTILCWGPRRPSRSASLWIRRGLGCWPRWRRWSSHWRSHMNGERGCCRLFWIVLVVGGDEPLKVLDCQCRLPGILFFRVAFPQDQIIELW